MSKKVPSVRREEALLEEHRESELEQSQVTWTGIEIATRGVQNSTAAELDKEMSGAPGKVESEKKSVNAPAVVELREEKELIQIEKETVVEIGFEETAAIEIESEVKTEHVQGPCLHHDDVLANPYKGLQVCKEKRIPKVSCIVHGVRRFFTRLGSKRNPGVRGRSAACCVKVNGTRVRKKCATDCVEGTSVPWCTGVSTVCASECTSKRECVAGCGSECTSEGMSTESELVVSGVRGRTPESAVARVRESPSERVIGGAAECTPVVSGTEYVPEEWVMTECTGCASEEWVARCAYGSATQASTLTGLECHRTTYSQSELLICVGFCVLRRPAGIGVASLLFGASCTIRAVLRPARSNPRFAGQGNRKGSREGKRGRSDAPLSVATFRSGKVGPSGVGPQGLTQG